MSSAFRITLASVAAAAALLPAVASAQDTKNQGYLVDTQGQNAIVKAVGGTVCVRTSDWTPARAVAECDPDLVRKPAPKPAPVVAPPPKPKPKPEAKPAKPVILNITERIELQNIPFDKAEMTADNKKDLDEFIGALQKATKARSAVTFGAVVVTGHTDRIGSDKYNQKLSERRATVVKDYLVNNLKVDPKLIFWEGKGKKEPIPVTKFCDNKMKRKQLIECLSPNRRVSVEVVGTATSLAKPKPAAAEPAAKPGAKPKP